MMKTVFLTDLDDTLFATARKQPPTADFTLATTLRDGSPSAYMSPQQQQFWRLWQENALCIPVTARNLETFQRVHVPFSDLAIINHGGTVLRTDGTPDPQWHAIQQTQAQASAAWLQAQYDHLARLADAAQMDVRLRLNHDCGLDLYVLLKSNCGDEAAVAALAAAWQRKHGDPMRGYVHCNGNNLAILPQWLGKAAAVAYVLDKLRARYGALLSIGCGDSHSDLGFMRLCDFWLTPSGSQLDRQIDNEQ